MIHLLGIQKQKKFHNINNIIATSPYNGSVNSTRI